MAETMGQIIKRLRKEKNLTQEELAAELNISAPAVSKWECDAGMPDISQLVPLANLFGVSIDALFSRNHENIDEQVEKLIEEIDGSFESYSDTFDRLNDALSIYPSHPRLLMKIVTTAEFMVTPEDSPKNSRILTTAVRAADMYIRNTDRIGDKIRMTAEKIDLLSKAGRYAEAEELADTLEMPITSREMYLAHISRCRQDYSEEIRHKQESIAQILGFLAVEIGELALTYRNNGQLEEAVYANMVNLRLPYLIHGEGKFHAPLFNWHNISGFEAAYELMLLERHEEAVDLLEKIFDYAEIQCACCSNFESVTSPLLDRIDLTPYHGELTEADYLWKIRYPDFEPLHKYERFHALLRRYEVYENGNTSCTDAR